MRVNIKILSLISLVVFILIALFVRSGESPGRIENLFSVSSFLFGIFVAFAVTNGYSRFNRLSEVLKSDEGNIYFIAKMAQVFDNSAKEKITSLIDSYLIAQIDYLLADFERSARTFNDLFEAVVGLKATDNIQILASDKMIDSLAESAKNRKIIESLVKQSMQRFEWVCILSLLAVILFCIFYLNDGSFVSIITSVLLSTVAMIFTLILKNLDDLRWKENTWIWHDLECFFKELNLLPYYPRGVLNSGRAKPEKGQKIRVADYPKPYPDMTGKTIEIIEI